MWNLGIFYGVIDSGVTWGETVGETRAPISSGPPTAHLLIPATHCRFSNGGPLGGGQSSVGGTQRIPPQGPVVMPLVTD